MGKDMRVGMGWGSYVGGADYNHVNERDVSMVKGMGRGHDIDVGRQGY